MYPIECFKYCISLSLIGWNDSNDVLPQKYHGSFNIMSLETHDPVEDEDDDDDDDEDDDEELPALYCLINSFRRSLVSTFFVVLWCVLSK